MKLSFVEALDFTEVVYEYFGSDMEFAVFQEALLANPERGDVMPGCAGLRKTRWRDTRRGKGTRGGLRIIYLHVPDAGRVLLLDVYDKEGAFLGSGNFRISQNEVTGLTANVTAIPLTQRLP